MCEITYFLNDAFLSERKYDLLEYKEILFDESDVDQILQMTTSRIIGLR